MLKPKWWFSVAYARWYPVTGQRAMGTNWNTGSSIWTWEKTSSLWGWQSTGTGCLERLWSLLLWRYSKPSWTRCCATCSSDPALAGGLDQMISRCPFQPLPFCDSVHLWLNNLRCPSLPALPSVCFYVPVLMCSVWWVVRNLPEVSGSSPTDAAYWPT